MLKQEANYAKIIPGIEEADETVRAICDGAVDAFVMKDGDGHRVYTLEGADLPYSVLVERMQQGAAILDTSGNILYCNSSLEELVGAPHGSLIGVPLQRFLNGNDLPLLGTLLRETLAGPREAEISVRRVDGVEVPASLSFRLLTHDKSSIGILFTDLTSQKQQEELTVRIQQTQDEERRRIARDLHDSVGQLLAALSMNIARVTDESHKLSPDVAKLVTENASLVNQITNEIRTISHLLHPPLLDEVGLPSALRWYADGFAQRSKIQTTLDMPEKLDRLSPETEIAVFRAVQECLTNIHRHSGSSSCSINVVQDADQLRIEVRDSGRGIPEARQSTLTSSGGVGLRGMRERIRQLGGTFEIESSPKGTVVAVTLPVVWNKNLSMKKDQDNGKCNAVSSHSEPVRSIPSQHPTK
jgi:two-component system, NarL family, sensor kinase